MRQIVATLLALAVLAPGAPAWAEPPARESTAQKVSYGAGSALGTAVYTPLKGLLCAIGGAASGFVFLSSGPRAMRTVANASCTGTWVITQEILKGERPLDVVPEPPCCGYPDNP
jgi:hypothetical protein